MTSGSGGILHHKPRHGGRVFNELVIMSLKATAFGRGVLAELGGLPLMALPGDQPRAILWGYSELTQMAHLGAVYWQQNGELECT